MVFTENRNYRFPVNPGDFYEIEDQAKRLDRCDEANRGNAAHATDFDPPIYNVWKPQEKTPGSHRIR